MLCCARLASERGGQAQPYTASPRRQACLDAAVLQRKLRLLRAARSASLLLDLVLHSHAQAAHPAQLDYAAGGAGARLVDLGREHTASQIISVSVFVLGCYPRVLLAAPPAASGAVRCACGGAVLAAPSPKQSLSKVQPG